MLKGFDKETQPLKNNTLKNKLFFILNSFFRNNKPTLLKRWADVQKPFKINKQRLDLLGE